MKSQILILVLVLLITVIIGAVLYNTKAINDIKSDVVIIKETTVKNDDSVNEAVGWKTYLSEKYNFTIKYPENYESKFIKADVVAFGPVGFSAPAPLTINVFKPTPYKSFDGFIDSELANFGVRDCRKMVFKDKPAYECVDLGMIQSYLVVVDHDGMVYELIFNTGNKDTLLENKNALDDSQKLMLSTFEFSNDSYKTEDQIKIIEATKIFCDTNNLTCPQITVIEQDDNYAIADDGLKLKYFLSFEGDEWQVGIASDEANICDTGTDHSGLVRYCKNRL